MNVSHNTIHELEVLRYEAESNAIAAAALAEKFHKAIVDAIAVLEDPRTHESRLDALAILKKALSP